LADGRRIHVGVEERFAPARKAHVALSVAPGEIDALATRLSAVGVAIVWDEELSVRRFYAEDPWGSRIEFVEEEGETGEKGEKKKKKEEEEEERGRAR
jgi:hypothetical protein